MPRIVKTAEERRREIVDCAQTLFFAKGYEATTIADILGQTGLSKGAFYHHFQSKEDLLDALTGRIAAAIVASAQDILEDRSVGALARINLFFARSSEWKLETAPMLNAAYATIFKPENAALYQRMIRAAVKALAPVLTPIVEQGVRDREFDVPDPGIVAEMLLHLANARQAIVAEAVEEAAQGGSETAIAVLEKRIAVEAEIINRILGLRHGSVQLFEPGYLRSMLTAMGTMVRAQAAGHAA